MVKEKPTKTKNTRKPAVKPVQKRTSPKRKGKKKVQKEVPAWCRYLLAVLVVFVFVSGFYWFFIRPYAYRWKPCYGLKGYGICMPAGYQIHGIDISHYQGDVKWKMLEQTRQGQFPVSFIFMKATEGGDYKDRRFDENFRRAKEAGLIRGAYHFYNPYTDPIRQADFFITQVDLKKGDLAPVLDIERKPRDKAQLQADLKVFLKRLELHYGVNPIIYTSFKYKTRYLDAPEFDAYPFWIAHYYVDSLSYVGAWQFWQHTDYGTVPGIDTSVDLNVFNGSQEELNQYLVK